MNNEALHLCRVCGLFHPDYFPWGEDGRVASFDICDCYGTTFGYQDCQPIVIERYQTKWIDKGCSWREPKLKPSDWKWEEQRKNLEWLAILKVELIPSSAPTVRLGDLYPGLKERKR